VILYLVVILVAALATAVAALTRARTARTARRACEEGCRQLEAASLSATGVPEQDGRAREMEVAGQLAADVAHGLNDVLTAITGHTELLIANLPPDDPGVLDAIEIRRGALSAARLTRQLLALSRNQPGLIEVIDVNAVAERTAASLRRLDRSPAQTAPIVQAYATVLIVDDDRRVRDLAKLVLVHAGYDVVAVAGPHDALAALRRQPDITILLIDVVLPEMNGYDLAAEARKIAPDAHIIFMSGFAFDTIRQPTADDFLAKPFTIESLANLVQQAAARSRPVASAFP
jgi:CheY-like chemotaxis protein